jgi:DMSO/TMAO reductase YedYZ molybdopterin-dependent catalytic subunit
MSGAALDRLLGLLIAAILATGVFTWRAGSPDTWWLYLLHGLLAGALLAAGALKLRRSLPRALAGRRWRQLLVSVPFALATMLSLVIGFAWVAGGQYVEIGPWTLLGWHGIVAWAVLAFAALHLVMRGRWRVLRPPRLPAARRLSRRTLVAGGALAFSGAAVWGAAEVLDRLSAVPRRFTGSRWLPVGVIPPPTTFFGEPTPPVDQAAWRLSVVGAVDRPLELSVDELNALGTSDMTAVLDCTGGWAMETTWHGVPMPVLLAAAGVRSEAVALEIRSVTGWGASMSLDEGEGTLLATRVAGGALPIDNGAPCRLVVPNRRGLDWVKWVAEVRVVA